MKNIFSTYHPLINFIYILFVLIFIMVLYNPIYLLISFLIGFIYLIYLSGIKEVLKTLKFAIPTMIILLIINCIFNSNGITLLFYLFDSIPITLESVVFSLFSCLMLISVMLWFKIYNILINNEKFMFLFSKVFSNTSLILSMTLRFIDVTKYKLNAINNSIKGMLLIENNKIKNKISNGIKKCNILLSISLEDSVETSDSMKSRGYGLNKRTTFYKYKFKTSDLLALIFIILLISFMIYLIFTNSTYFMFYPIITRLNSILKFKNIFGYFLYSIFLLTPLLIQLKENIKWKLLK